MSEMSSSEKPEFCLPRVLGSTMFCVAATRSGQHSSNHARGKDGGGATGTGTRGTETRREGLGGSGMAHLG